MSYSRCAFTVATRLVALSALALLTACSGGSSKTASAPPPNLSIYYMLAPVDGGSCWVQDASGNLLAGPELTSAGVVHFSNVAPTTAPAMVTCQGGTYTDEATGKTTIGTRLRSYASVGTTPVNAVVTPLSELAVRVLGTRPAATEFEPILDEVASEFGLADIDVAKLVPANVSVTGMGTDQASHFGAVLAAFSQLEMRGVAGANTGAVLTRLVAALDTSGEFKDRAMRGQFATSLYELANNARLKTVLGPDRIARLRPIYDNMTHEHVEPEIYEIDTEQSLSDASVSSNIEPDQESAIAIYGEDMSLSLRVTLGGKACRLRDLATLDHESDSEEQVMYAECPAQTAGTVSLLIFDKTNQIFSNAIAVVPEPEQEAARKRSHASLSCDPLTSPPGVGSAPSCGIGSDGANDVAGAVTAVAPTINTVSGALVYDKLRTFAVKGVRVELLDRAAANAILMNTVTDDNGQYRFPNVGVGKDVMVRVKAQLQRSRGANTSGPEYLFSVRDNTSAGSIKALYVLDSAALTTKSGSNRVNLNAELGFDASGQVGAAGARQSAPFSILEVVYNATVKLQQADPNLTMPELNIYWSADNVGVSGEPSKGQIGTSHYASHGEMPGVFILGKADVDTDEFDQGVIGHELGHYLQQVLSYSDNPGGAHSASDVKDASLAYGEGYGTAVGCLLIDSPFYIDSSGARQGSGGVTNLSQPMDPARNSKGFYSENSIAYVMYNIGIRHGFAPLWKAVSALRQGHASATVFAFLSAFITQNPSLPLSDLLNAENIRSTDLLGATAAGLAPDTAIDNAASKGATDLEQLYLSVTLAPAAPAASASNISPNAAPFCVNRNLPGANNANGLGLSRRFIFTANYTGTMGIKAVDDTARNFDDQSTFLNARDDSGTNIAVYGWDGGVAQINVVQGRTYTVRLRVGDPVAIFDGNRCGNQLSLWRLT